MKNVSTIWTEKDKIIKKLCFLEYKTEIKQHLLQTRQISLLPKYNFLVEFSYVCSHLAMQAFKRLGTKFVAGSRRHGPCVLFLNMWQKILLQMSGNTINKTKYVITTSAE
jgi:hypothetical protein